MLKELRKVKKLCSKLSADDLQQHLILSIKQAQEELNNLHDAYGVSSSSSKRFDYKGQSLTYTHIAEYVLFIKALKSVLVELVIYGKKHMDYVDTVYDMIANYELELKHYEDIHGR